jgi:Leucine-rich repeat (LRR) protein
MKLTTLACNSTRVTDLSPLAGMPLETFTWFAGQKVDLSVLRHMPLKFVDLIRTGVTDLSPLHDCPSLTRLDLTENKIPAANVAALQAALPKCKITWDDPAATNTLADPAFQQWLKETQALPADKQIEAVAQKLVEINPGFDGQLAGGYNLMKKPKIENGVVTAVGVVSNEVTDIAPLQAFTGLTNLRCEALDRMGGGKLVDLSPLRGMPLSIFSCGGNRITDLSPLSGMPLTILEIYSTPVTDLAPLAGMPLAELNCNNAWLLSDLSPLKGLPLTKFFCNGTKVTDLKPLADMALTAFTWTGGLDVDLSVLRGKPLRWVELVHCKMTDISPLADCPKLEELGLGNSTVDPAQVAALQKALPNCKIFGYEPPKPPEPARP